MSFKLKALGLAALAAMSIGVVTAMDASATVSGHFTSDAVDGHTIVSQESSSKSEHEFVIKGATGPRILCEKFIAFGTAASSTVTQVQGSTEAKNCHTEGSEAVTLFHMNGCVGQGWSNSAGSPTTALSCPAGKNLVVTHPNCTITAPPQTVANGFTTTTAETNGKHVITLDVNIKYNVQYHGLCQFLVPTNSTVSITGSTLIWGQNTLGELVNITST